MEAAWLTRRLLVYASDGETDDPGVETREDEIMMPQK